ncbi:MAG: methylated-DNA--[protein]-cysteine S-methyltransferase [Alphaproteobacteria bacterium]|nr:methylated-DNA--[protein]-cysteine S-methyltransferase [Alphaproteobacteria bacterium]
MKLLMKDKAPAKVMWGVVDSPAGKLAVGLTDKGEICRISFLRARRPQEAVAEWQAEWPHTLFESAKAMPKNLDGKPVMLVGTKFQQAVWKAMTQIPSGKAMGYGEVARRIGHPGAARAVGAACGANPVAYIVPCHRVVAANGKIGGFSGGPGIKEKLLKTEGYL